MKCDGFVGHASPGRCSRLGAYFCSLAGMSIASSGLVAQHIVQRL